jgi:tRNA (guanine37-N1)-methyltransferase
MKIDIVSLFPDFIRAGISHSIVARAVECGAASIAVHDPREKTADKRRTVDDAPYGGGAGMVLKPEPIFETVEEIAEPGAKIVLMSPQGRRFTQDVAKELAGDHQVILICGHYEGFDERIVEHLATDEISIGDYVLTGGELAALVITDAVVRLLPGVLGNADSALTESFEEDLLDFPQYTRPVEYRGWRVPDVLLSGHHAEIAAWRLLQQREKTRKTHPELWERYRARHENL